MRRVNSVDYGNFVRGESWPERYRRQMLIPHWDQERLRQSAILIVGSNSLAAVIAAGATALGVGTVILFDDTIIEDERSRGFLLSGATAGTPRVRVMEAALRAINPEVAVITVAARLASEIQLESLPLPNNIIVTSGESFDAELCAYYAESLMAGTRLIVANASETEGSVASWTPDIERQQFAELPTTDAQVEPSMAVSCVIGGLALTEVLVGMLPVWFGDTVPYWMANDPLARAIRYSSTQRQRFFTRTVDGLSADAEADALSLASHSSNGHKRGRFVLVGAGGLGTWFGISAAADLHTSSITIYDPDMIAQHNLNRQILYADAVGEPKASTLARKLRAINPQLQAIAVEERVPADFIEAHSSEIDAVVSAVDNFTTRAFLQEACGNNSLPIINGGSGAMQAEVAVYVPERSSCFDCVMSLGRLAKEESAHPLSCSAAPEPSTVIANMIAGGLMAAEGQNLLAKPHNILRGVLAYDAYAPTLVGMRSVRPPCNCWNNNKEISK